MLSWLPDDVAIITVALVAGSVADRMRFSAFVWFAALWLLVVYVPIAHWVWGALAHAGRTAMKPASSTLLVAPWCTSMPHRRPCRRLYRRQPPGYGSENLRPTISRLR